MKKRFGLHCLVLALTLVLMLLPCLFTEAEAAASTAVYIDGIYMTSDQYMATGTRYLVATKPAGGYVYFKDGVLTLHDFELTATHGIAIEANQDLTITLSGTSTITQNHDASEGIQVDGNLIFNGYGKLSITNNASANRDAICSDGDMTIQSGTIVSRSTGQGNALHVPLGKKMTISGGTVTATGGTGHGIYAPELLISGGTVKAYTEYGNGIYCYEDLSITGGTITLESNSRDAAIYAKENMTVSGGRVTISAADTGVYILGDMSLTGGVVDIDAKYSGVKSFDTGNVLIGGCELNITADIGINVKYSTVTLGRNSWVTITTETDRGIVCKNFICEDTAEKILIVAKKSGTAAVKADSYTLPTALAVSASPYSDGSGALVPKPSAMSQMSYLYIRQADIYVGGVPMGFGDYLAQGGKAASTYKLTGNYAHTTLNGENDELILSDFAITATGDTPGIKSAGKLVVTVLGDSTITTEKGAGILVENSSLYVQGDSDLAIKTTTGDGIRVVSGDYQHFSTNLKLEAGGMGISCSKNVKISSGDLDIKSGTYGICCNKFNMTGGKLLACGNIRAIDETMGFNYSSLPIFASTSPSGTLGTYKYANHNSYKAISIGYTTAPVLSIPGDVDNDGDVDMDDAIYLLFHVNFPDAYPVDQPANFDGLGEVTMDDAIYLLFHVNFPESYPLN